VGNPGARWPSQYKGRFLQSTAKTKMNEKEQQPGGIGEAAEGWVGLFSGIGGYLIDNFGYSIYRYSLSRSLSSDPSFLLSISVK